MRPSLGLIALPCLLEPKARCEPSQMLWLCSSSCPTLPWREEPPLPPLPLVHLHCGCKWKWLQVKSNLRKRLVLAPEEVLPSQEQRSSAGEQSHWATCKQAERGCRAALSSPLLPWGQGVAVAEPAVALGVGGNPPPERLIIETLASVLD